MKAIVCNETGALENLTLQESVNPEPGKGEILLDVKAAGINFPDLLTVQGKYQFKPPLPFTPGTEVAGIVAAVGEGVTRRKVGDKVIATLQIGAFAEQCVASEHSVYEMAQSMSFEHGAGFSITYGTSYYALKQRANIQPGETLLVLGAAGGVGIATIQIAKAMGATVIAAAGSEEKLDFACQAGADMRINYSTENLKERVKELTKGKGAEAVLDFVAERGTTSKGLAMTREMGSYYVVGYGEDINVSAFEMVTTEKNIIGNLVGTWAELTELMSLADKGKVNLATQEYSLANANLALQDLNNGKVKGRAVLVP